MDIRGTIKNYIAKSILATVGAILYGASGGPAELSPGTSGLALVTKGAAAAPAWDGPNVVDDVNAVALQFLKVNIGVWNMDSTDSKDIAHGITDITDIVGVQVVVQNDAQTKVLGLPAMPLTAPPGEDGFWEIGTTNIRLYRKTGGYFDNTNFDDAVMNRGYILFTLLG